MIESISSTSADLAERSQPRGDGFSMVLVVLLRYRRMLVFAPLISTFLIVSFLLLLPRSYSAGAVFLPKAEGTVQSLAGLAAQFGVAVPGGTASSPRVYASLLRSRQLLRQAILHEYHVIDRKGLPMFRDTVTLAGNLIELLEIKGASDAERVHKALESLEKRLSVNVDDIAGTVSFRAKLPWADGAQQLADFLLATL